MIVQYREQKQIKTLVLAVSPRKDYIHISLQNSTYYNYFGSKTLQPWASEIHFS